MGKQSPHSSDKVPAVVLGAGITALGVIRILGRQNIESFFISDRNDYAKRSRWADPLALNVDPLLTPDELAALLEPLDLERAVLFPCSDTFLKAVVGLPDRLASRFPTSLPSPDTLDILVNKGKFSVALLEAGIPHPETFIIDSADKLKALSAQHFKNHFLKPFYSKPFQLEFHVKAFRVNSLEDAFRKFAITQEANQPVMLQEYIPGPSNRHYFVDGFIDREGEIRALFPRRRERIYPPDFGNSSYCVSIPPAEASQALESVRKLIKHIGFRGIFSAEFKLDERDNHFKILEVNARPWWYIDFAYQCGVDTCRMAYRDALGMSVDRIEQYDEGVGCMYVLDDLRAASKMVFKRKLSVFTWIRQLLTAKKPIFALDDPIPAVANALARPFRYARKKFKR